ncbi:TPM domain-containing protein, partial [Gemmiger formicilis]|uniref:TPM domain-containing protein n=1 Tax=Gemmiger formicilis TaxID=745368 RepID=UPI00195B6A48
MNKRRLLPRFVGVMTAAALCAACALPVLAAPQADPDKAVIDNADILSKDTETYVTNISTALQDTCGAQIGVYTVDTIGNYTMEGYTYELANDWGLGDADKDNGIVLLLAPGEDNYHAMCGAGLETQFTVQMLQTILNEDMEPNWVNKDYDTGTRQTVYAMAQKLCTIYGLTINLDDVAAGNFNSVSGGSYQSAPPDRGGVSFTGILVLVAVLAVVVVLLASPRRRYGGYRGPTFIWFGGWPRG